jgi:predicted type IV restriction endonuclease
MIQTIAISDAILSLNDVYDKFHLSRTLDPQFFPEWVDNLPELTDTEKASLNRLKTRFLNYVADGMITEGTINLIIISPLLEILGLFDPPFKVRREAYVKVELEDEDTVLQGRIDALVVQEQFWVVVIEAKRFGFTASLAVPQALAYMMANPQPERPVFGMVTNGQHYIFIKLNQQTGQYDLSDEFSLLKPSKNELYEVLPVMKRIAGLIV